MPGPRSTDPDQSGRNVASDNSTMEWKPISIAPFDRHLELAVINYYGTHTAGPLDPVIRPLEGDAGLVG